MVSHFFKVLKRGISIGKKVMIILLVYLFIFGVFLHYFTKDRPLAKTNNTLQNNRQEIYKIISDKKLNSTKEGRTIVKVYRTMTCVITGEACTDNPSDGDKNSDNSIIGSISNLMIVPYTNPPASGIYWAYSGLQNVGFIPKTYAAGIGFNSLTVFIPIWDAFRKLSYLILVLVIITIGFMIMFRMKLNPQTVISVENALPKIVVTLILITFSYAIVGFLIDIMYLVILVGIDIIGTPLGVNVAYYQKDILTSNVFFNYIFNIKNMGIYGKAMLGIFAILPTSMKAILTTLWLIISAIVVIRWLPGFGTFVSALFGDATAEISAVVAGITINVGKIMGFFIALIIVVAAAIAILLFLVIVIFPLTFLFLCFRILFTLLSSLIQIILYLIFAPLFILLEAIPGRSSFTSWLRNIIGNLSVFPLVIFLIMITNGMTDLYTGNQPVFTPPFLTGFYPQAIAALITGSMLLIIPDLAKLLKQSIIGKGGLQLPVGPGTLFGAAGTTVGSLMSGAQQIYYLNTAKTALFGDKQHNQEGMLGSLFDGVKKNLHKS